jgi:hypothetical protein
MQTSMVSLWSAGKSEAAHGMNVIDCGDLAGVRWLICA